MNVSYFNLYNGYILKVSDVLLIHNVKYDVTRNSTTGNYYLTTLGDNRKVFYELHLSEEKYLDLAKTFDSTGYGAFPEFNTLENLTAFVKALYELSPYKVGDKVIIKKRIKGKYDYPCNFVDEMSILAGEEYVIEDILMITYDISTCSAYNGDPHQYILKTSGFMWHSSMFEKVSDSSTKEINKIEKTSTEPVNNQIIVKSKQVTKTIIKL